MTQATVDLPDPLENPPPTTGAHADDLLSKLASDEIDRLLAETTPEASVPEVVIAQLPPTAATSVVVEPTTAGDLDAVLATAAAERTALHADDEHAVPLPLVEAPAEADHVPFMLKPLVWINAPIEPWSDQLRDMMGKVAVVTLVNAIAVLTYVLIFRHGK